jgi:hypothetical protein
MHDHKAAGTVKNSIQNGLVPIWVVLFLIVVLAAIIFIPRVVTSKDAAMSDGATMGNVAGVSSDDPGANGVIPPAPKPQITHVTVPKSVKAVYISSWVAGTPSLRSKIISLVDKTELNAVVIDIKDYTGMVSFTPSTITDAGKTVLAEGCIEERIKDASDFIKMLHEKNIYVIGRVATFQDPCMVKKHPEWAVKTKSTGSIWKDHKGITWIDAGSNDAWKYNVAIAKASHDIGFDEINFDYIRYPSDGNMEDIAFPVSGTRERSETLKVFFAYIDKELRGGRAVGVQKPVPAVTSASAGTTTTPPVKPSILPRYTLASDPAFDDMAKEFGLGIAPSAARIADVNVDGKKVTTDLDNAQRIIVSADLFGFVTTNNDDLGIGQVLEKVAPYVDFIDPMVYPSHYPKTFIGFANPASHPYEVVQYAMSGGVKKMQAVGLNPLKLRPWLQDFNLGATYTADMVRAQVKATYDVGLTSWLFWDASNTYTPGGALQLGAAPVATPPSATAETTTAQ